MAECRDGFSAELGSCARANRRTGRQDFDASAFAAAAKRPTIVDADMAAFAGRAGVAVVDAAIENNAGANAGSDRGIENVAESAGRAPARFGEGGGICVIVHFARARDTSTRFSRPAESFASTADLED